MRYRLQILLALIGCLLLATQLHAQVHNDGPMIVKARLRQMNPTFPETDVTFFSTGSQPDDMSYYIWGRDLPDVDLVTIGGGWGNGSGCLIEPYSFGYLPTVFDTVFFNQFYPTTQTPHAIEVRTDFWEDESPDQLLGVGCGGSRCAFEYGFCCGGSLFGVCMGALDDDDLRCNSGTTTPYATLDFRLGPPGQWYSHGNVGGNCINNIYAPTIETFYRNAYGEDCATPISLGTLSPGFTPVSHANAVDGYADDVAYTGGGRDAVYTFTLTQPMWLDISTCGGGTCPTDLVLVNSSCTVLQSNSGACGNGSTISQAFCVAGTYHVAVEARNNTPTGTFTITISQSSNAMLSMTAGPDVSTCPGIPVTIGPGIPPSGGTPPYTYIWTPPTGLSTAILLNPTAVSLAQQQYVLTVADANGCVASDTMLLLMQGGAPFSLGADTVVCSGAPITLSGPNGGGTYAWSTGATTPSVLISNPGQYSLTVTTNGCQAMDTILIGAGTSNALFLTPDTAICPDTSMIVFATPGMATYLWSTGATTSSIVASLAGAYSVTATDGIGCPAQDTFHLSIIPDCVFPGDVDHDGDCDLTDALHLGALNGTPGLGRPAATTGWYGQVAPNWAGSYLGINHKHADSNGDALLNPADTNAIHLNFGQVHSRVGAVTGGPVVLRMVPQASTVLAGDWAKFDLYLEDAGGGAIDSVLGLAFKAIWSPMGMASAALRHADFSSCWFAPQGNQWSFTHVQPQVDGFVIARDNGTMTTGNGLVGTLHFLSSNALPAGQPFYFAPTLLEIEVIAADHQVRTGTFQMDSIYVTDTLIAVQTPLGNSLQIYPNPANGQATVLLPPGVERVQIYGTLGMLVQDIAVDGRRQLLLDLKGLSSGIWWVRAEGQGGAWVSKLQVRR